MWFVIQEGLDRAIAWLSYAWNRGLYGFTGLCQWSITIGVGLLTHSWWVAIGLFIGQIILLSMSPTESILSKLYIALCGAIGFLGGCWFGPLRTGAPFAGLAVGLMLASSAYTWENSWAAWEHKYLTFLDDAEPLLFN
jgi:hypothetical protein